MLTAGMAEMATAIPASAPVLRNSLRLRCGEPERERDSFVSFSLEVFMAGYFLNSRPVCLFDRVAAVNGDSLTDNQAGGRAA